MRVRGRRSWEVWPKKQSIVLVTPFFFSKCIHERLGIKKFGSFDHTYFIDGTLASFGLFAQRVLWMTYQQKIAT